jgi:hypothetical protein
MVHKHAMPRIVRGRWHFTFQASLKPGARDRFSPYRVSVAAAGKLLLETIRESERQERGRPSRAKHLASLSDVLWVQPKSRRRISRKAA